MNQQCGQRGFTLVEVAVSTLVIALILMVALQTVAGSRIHLRSVAEQAAGQALALDLLSEIATKAYEDPDGNPTFGREADETNHIRTALDDVDDYHGLIEAVHIDGTAADSSASDVWQREVELTLASANQTNLQATTDVGLKRITVTVRREGRLIARRETLRSARHDALFAQRVRED